MKISSGIHDYEVIFKRDLGFLNEILNAENSFIIVDSNVYEIYLKDKFEIDEDRIHIFEATEANKTIESVLTFCNKLMKISAKRNLNLISIGGGITQDTSGFAANILYRGVHWTFIPTTLLAACDSCIGGKTSLNYLSSKNMLGTFFPPEQIYICPEFFKSLKKKDYYSGLGEIVKFNILQGEKGLDSIESELGPLLSGDPDIVTEYTKTSLEFKKTFIEQDEYDRGVRIKLNFAHTFGHAVEVASGYDIAHGTAVAIGMMVANRVSFHRNMIGNELMERIEQLICRILPSEINLDLLESDVIVNAIRSDKKQINNSITAIIIDEAMALHIVHDVVEREILNAFNEVGTVIEAYFSRANP